MSRPLRFSRIHVRLTRAGQLYILLSLAFGVVAVNSGNNLLYLAVAGLMALLILSGFLALANLRGLEAAVHFPEEVYAGQPVTVKLDIFNRKKLLPTFLLYHKAGAAGASILFLAPGEGANLPFNAVFDRRGRRPMAAQVLLSPFPFGLVRRGGTWDPKVTCLVYPRPLAVSWTMVEKAELLGEEQSMPLAGVGGDYRGFRDYLPGDALSRVHWKGWLRHHRFMTKEFEAEGAPPVRFAYDDVPGPGREERVSQLAWLVRTAFRRGRAVGLTLPGKSFPPGSSAAHRKELLTALALLGEANARP